MPYILLAIVNQLGVTASAGVGVAQKVCMFIMLVPAAFMQSMTTFVMIQGLCGAFLVRVPVAFLMQHIAGNSLFLIGLAIPCSTVLQIIMCFAAYFYFRKRQRD